MTKLQWSLTNTPKSLKNYFKQTWWRLQIIFKSLFYNDFLDWNYAGDICMEPMFWFVENFTACLGPVFVLMVTLLTACIVYIAYWVGLPYWWEKSPAMTVILLLVGNWLLVNVCYNYYMGVRISAGYPPEGGLIPEAVSICKKCIKPKPPRTHHCSVCNKCVLKMDHHCLLGILFIMIFGMEIAYEEFFPAQEPELDGHPVRINNSEIIPVAESMDHLSEEELAEIARQTAEAETKEYRRKLIIFAALICTATFVALGALTWWHAGLITRGETSIEARINSIEAQKCRALGRLYQNPYNFGSRENWKLFLGITGRSWWRILFPSSHGPYGDGLTWRTIHDNKIS